MRRLHRYQPSYEWIGHVLRTSPGNIPYLKVRGGEAGREKRGEGQNPAVEGCCRTGGRPGWMAQSFGQQKGTFAIRAV